MTFLVAATASWLNWGFGLVIGAILAREVAKRVRLDFGWLVAAAYSGWVIWASGVSSSIAPSQAPHGNALNIVQKLTGVVLPFSQTVFTAFKLIPTLVVVVLVPVVFVATAAGQRGADLRPAGRAGPGQGSGPARQPGGAAEPLAGAEPRSRRPRRRRPRGDLDEQGRLA